MLKKVLFLSLICLVTGVSGSLFFTSKEKPVPIQSVYAAGSIKTVFVIVMENKDWASVKGAAAPYITNTLLPLGGHAENYHNVPISKGSLHPSEPNYLWLEGLTLCQIIPLAMTIIHQLPILLIHQII